MIPKGWKNVQFKGEGRDGYVEGGSLVRGLRKKRWVAGETCVLANKKTRRTLTTKKERGSGKNSERSLSLGRESKKREKDQESNRREEREMKERGCGKYPGSKRRPLAYEKESRRKK